MKNYIDKLQNCIDQYGKDCLVLAIQEKYKGIILCADFARAYDATNTAQLDNARILKAGTLMEIYRMQKYLFQEMA